MDVVHNLLSILEYLSEKFWKKQSRDIWQTNNYTLLKEVFIWDTEEWRLM